MCVAQCYLFVRGCCGCDAVLPLVCVCCVPVVGVRARVVVVLRMCRGAVIYVLGVNENEEEH